MSEKYIRKANGSYIINKNSKSYGKFKSLDDAIFARDLLAENDWKIEAIDEIQKIDDNYIVTAVIDEKLHILAKYKRKPSQEAIEKLIKKQIRNPNNSKYGLNITRIFDTYVIKKRIAGDDYIFGYYDNLKDAEFVRNHLLDNNWDINSFSQIQYDEETSTYKVVEVIDDRAYVLDTFKNREDIDISKCHEEFLNKITKHKLGLAQHSFLDELKDMIPDLEEKFNIKADDDVWNFTETQNPLNDIIFNLTPFQKSVYDAVDDSTFDEIKRSLIRYRSKNFDEKIQRNLDELEKSGLIFKNQNHYMKRN